jgi:hypothetical protein
MPLSRDPPKTRAAWFGFAAIAAAFIGYRVYETRNQDVPSARPGAAPSTQAASAAPVDAGRPPPVPLDPAVRRRMKLPPRRSHVSSLAFGKGRLGQIAGDELIVRDGATYRVELKFEVHKPRVVAPLADGSLLCPGEKRTLRLLWHDQKPRLYPPIPNLPGFQIFADRVDAERMWSISASGKTLFGYALAEGRGDLLAPKEWVELDGFDRRAFGLLRDGSFVYSTNSGFTRFRGTGRKEPLQAISTAVVRVLPGSRPDTVWLLHLDRRASLHSLVGGKLARLETVTLEADPFDADSAGRFLAVLELDQPSDGPWTFVLEVFDVSGKRQFREALPTVESLDQDWIERLTENRGLALSSDPPRVAIGGPTELTVFDARNGTKVFAEP